MQISRLGEWKVGRMILFFSLYTIISFSMDMPNASDVSVPVILQHSGPLPVKNIILFDPQEESKKGRLWDDIVPGKIVITPDGKGVIVSDCGRVRHVQFDTSKIDVIIKHQCLKKIPLIAVSQKEDASLMVVSACNYHSEQDNKGVAEYAVYVHGFSSFQHVDFPIQAISLDALGNVLAIASDSFVRVIDLNKKTNNIAQFRRKYFDDGHWLVDIAVHAKGNGVIIAGSYGDIQWMSYEQNLSNLKQVKTTDKIKKIYYPKLDELLYLTDQGEAKVVKMEELFEKDNDQIIGTISFARSSNYDNVAADLGEQVAVAFWTGDIKMAQDSRQKIKIYRKAEHSIDKFIVEFSDLEESYNYRTSFGTRDVGVGHLLRVALCGKTVVALATDGKMRVWSLPEKNTSYIDPGITITKEVHHIKGRSSSAKTYKNPFALLTGDEQPKDEGIQRRGRSHSVKSVPMTSEVGTEPIEKPRKISPRITNIINRSAGRISRENSPTNSPHSPHRRELSINFSADTIDNSREAKEVKHTDEK